MEENIINWINHISKKRSELDGFAICPYAKKALLDNKIFISYISYEPEDFISRYMESFVGDYEVVLFLNSIGNLTNDDCVVIINNLNKNFNNIIFLKDHPDDPGYINGIRTGNEQYPVIIAQPKDKLINARNALKNSSYYDHWSDEYKKEIWSYGNES